MSHRVLPPYGDMNLFWINGLGESIDRVVAEKDAWNDAIVSVFEKEAGSLQLKNPNTNLPRNALLLWVWLELQLYMPLTLENEAIKVLGRSRPDAQENFRENLLKKRNAYV